jgi:hypothetical protein
MPGAGGGATHAGDQRRVVRWGRSGDDGTTASRPAQRTACSHAAMRMQQQSTQQPAVAGSHAVIRKGLYIPYLRFID